MIKNKHIILLIRAIIKLMPSTMASKQFCKPEGFLGKYILWKLFEIGNARLLTFMMSQYDHKKDDVVMDIGFGPGKLFEPLIKAAPDGKVVGIDFSDDMVNKVSDIHSAFIESGNLELKCASIEEIPYPDNFFNTVYTANTLYFWPDPEKNINEVKRVLKSNGKLIIGFRTEEQIKELNLDTNIFKFYKEEDAQFLLKNAGFKSVEIKRKKDGKFDSYCAVGMK